MGFYSQRFGSIGLCALLGILPSCYANGQQKLEQQYISEPAQQTLEELPPIFNKPIEEIESKGYPASPLKSATGLTDDSYMSESVLTSKKPAADIIVIEPGVPHFTSKGDAGRYVANQLGVLSLYAKTSVGNAWKVGGDSKVRTSFGLRNLTEPRIQITIDDVANSQFTIKASSTLRKPAEIALYRRVDGGEVGIYGTLEREGDVRAYIGIRANNLRIFQRFKYSNTSK